MRYIIIIIIIIINYYHFTELNKLADLYEISARYAAY